MTRTEDNKVDSEDNRGGRDLQIVSKAHKDTTCNKDKQWKTRETNEA